MTPSHLLDLGHRHGAGGLGAVMSALWAVLEQRPLGWVLGAHAEGIWMPGLEFKLRDQLKEEAGVSRAAWG